MTARPPTGAPRPAGPPPAGRPSGPPAVRGGPTGAFPHRPGFGTVGKKAMIIANHWPSQNAITKPVEQYDVDITPESKSIAINRRIFNMIVDHPENRAIFAGNAKYIVYDGRKIAFAPQKLELGPAQAAKLEVVLPEDNGKGAPGAGPAPQPGPAARPPGGKAPPERKFTMAIKWAVQVDMTRLQQFLEGKLPPGVTPQDAINVYDAILRHVASKIPGCVPVGRGWYLQELFSRSPKDRDLGGGAEAWNGCKISMRPGQNKMTLNADLATTAFLAPGPLMEVASCILGRSGGTRGDPFARELPERDIQRMEKVLKTYTVKTTHRTTGRKRYRFNKFTLTPANRTMFDYDADGARRQISVEEYMEKTYNIRLQYPHLPCVVVGPKDRQIYLPMELCEVPAGQQLRRKLDEQQTSAMIRIAQQRPMDRLNRTSDAVNELVGKVREGTTYRDNEYLRAFDVRLSQHPASLEVRILEPPVVSYHPKSREKEIKPRDGTWNLRDKMVAHGKELSSWSVLVFAPPTSVKKETVDTFVKQLVQTCNRTGLRITEEKPPLRYGRDANVEDNLKAAFMDAGQGCRKKPQMILVVLPDTNPRRYAEIKRVSDTVIGIITQCVQQKHVFKANVQYCANLCLKMNVKLGGFNAFLARGQLPFISEAETIVLGADVTHPGPREDEARPSIAAMVGSLDAQCARFAATLRCQRSPDKTKRNDIIQDVYVMVTELLRAFYRTTQTKPKRIIFYRDGASEGQFQEIRQTEIAAVKRACADIEKLSGSGREYNPPVTFIVVTKRHHTRFFPKRREEADRSGNVMPGTVVDKLIGHPVDWDFFLNSHPGLQGTSRCAHYHVLHDENGLTSDKLQGMTYRLCYLYARCTRAVSVCPPIYYADLVAARARFHFKGMEWSEEASSTQGSEAGRLWDERFAKVKDELKAVMYYM